jgi:hypothetical protein
MVSRIRQPLRGRCRKLAGISTTDDVGGFLLLQSALRPDGRAGRIASAVHPAQFL